jgi:hypothetical protein
VAKHQEQLTEVQMAWLNLSGYQVEDATHEVVKKQKWKTHLRRIPNEPGYERDHSFTKAQCGGLVYASSLFSSVIKSPTCISCIRWVRRRVSG